MMVSHVPLIRLCMFCTLGEALARQVCLLSLCRHGCGSKIGTPNGTLASGNMDQNLWSPGGSILTHTHMSVQRYGAWDHG